jgi:hypothetical protein
VVEYWFSVRVALYHSQNEYLYTASMSDATIVRPKSPSSEVEFA